MIKMDWQIFQKRKQRRSCHKNSQMKYESQRHRLKGRGQSLCGQNASKYQIARAGLQGDESGSTVSHQGVHTTCIHTFFFKIKTIYSNISKTYLV
jgi:hypothetical protein